MVYTLRQTFTVCLGILAIAQQQSWLMNVAAMEFDMVFQTKCVFDTVVFESPVRITYEAFQTSNSEIKVPLTVRVMDEAGKEVFARNDVDSGVFHLKDLKEGSYKTCFTAKNYHTAQGTRIRYAWDEGVEAEDWANVAKREKLDAITTELRRLELGAHIIHSELQHIRRKEEILRDVNEKTNSMVAFLSIGALLTCVGLAGFQIWSLRKFFIHKKVL